MRSLSTFSPNNRGFTLLEVIIVIGLLTTILALGLFVSFDVFRGYNARSERDVVVSLLQKARSRSMNNLYQTSWGVCYSAPNYILFRGSTCTPAAATNETTAANPGVTITGLSGVVFSQLAGTTTGATVTIVQGGRTTTVIINNEGAIIW